MTDSGNPIYNAKHIWQMNQQFWADKRLKLPDGTAIAAYITKNSH